MEQRSNAWLKTGATTFLSILAAFVVSGIVLLIGGHSPIEAFGTMAQGAFGDADAWGKTLAKTTPLILTGLAVAIAFKGGLFNIGAEGQLYLGGMTAALVGVYMTGVPGFIHAFIALAAGGIVGALWAGIAAYMKVKWKAHEVIVTIMMNYIATLFTAYLVNYTFKAEGMVPRTEEVAASVQLPTLIPHSQLTVGLFIAIGCALFLFWFMKYTVPGYEIRAVGLNPDAARTGGISIGWRMIFAMLLSGFFAAIAGGVEVLGVHHYFLQGISPGYGFDGIAVAVLARNNPIAILFSALLFGALRAGATGLDRHTDIPGDFVVMIQAFVVIFVATPWLVRKYKLRKKRVNQHGS
ncbi:ABC transporter permease [Cohnella algarum]|uniref:ABC transporter permease n=1 Tax=Cohnella algarum TaxID=2044859 RepID=UPI00196716DA|nr:ABC transporter permease [Cohnella algarum]MBN2979807.1 ABC transporter permease [Cohnella algarum]